MKLNIESLNKLEVSKKHPELKELISKLETGLPRYEMIELLQFLKNEIVKRQDYEVAAVLREYETSMFNDVFGDRSRDIIDKKLLFCTFDFAKEKDMDLYARLKEMTIEEVEKEIDEELGITSGALSLTAGKFLFYVKNGLLEFPEGNQHGIKALNV